MKTMKRFTSLFALILALYSCNQVDVNSKAQDLYSIFQDPPAEARPFVRWWWNGNKIKAEEIDRELELLKAAGFGGVEINPIALPEAIHTIDKSHVWMSDEWIDLVVHACRKTKDLGMIADIIAGTGWPFGGEFLKDQETSQRMVNDHISYKSGSIVEVDEEALIALYKEKHKNSRLQKQLSSRTTYRLSYLSLVPENCSSADQVIDLTEFKDEAGRLTYKIETPGNYLLSYGLIQQNFRDVTLGAPGGAGPVMDHYKKEITLMYLSRLKEISERTGIPLSDLIRAVFCDSIEVSGANWTDGFAELFYTAYGYRMDNWMPFLFYLANSDYSADSHTKSFTTEFQDQLKRVRYDYNKLLVETFLKNFTWAYKDFCNENGILCRYQAYGTPFFMGMLDGYMIPDIPESNNWIYTVEMKDSIWKWNDSHGYMNWNMHASAGAHLTGKRITSCETMTNTRAVFRTTLEEIKQHDDMNFITGINHSVLHGYNYSPPEEIFPGWIRFGTYFSEYNTWWKHLHHWVDYNARLSSVFQNSQAKKSIAIIGPTADVWGDYGLSRNKYQGTTPYLYKLWEPISQLGYSCEYINQGVLERATIKNGTITYGDMNYKLLVLASLKSLSPEAAIAVKTLLESGGKVIVIDQLPDQSLGFNNYRENDYIVKSTMENMVANYPQTLIQTTSPESLDQLMAWVESFIILSGIAPDVRISHPSVKVYQIHQYTEDEDIYFFTNIHRFESTSFEAEFPVEGKYPYLWNPETGERTAYYYNSSPDVLKINLEPLQSLLLVFENEKPGSLPRRLTKEVTDSRIVEGIWKVTGQRVDNATFNWEMTELIDFSESTDKTQSSFGGELSYRIIISNTDHFTHIDLGDVNEGITELYVNGKKAGKRWYGQAEYPVAEFLKEGSNDIEIRYTTVLANYCKSIDNPLSNVWTIKYTDLVPTGLQGPVRLLKY